MPQRLTSAPSLVDHESRISALERADEDNTRTLRDLSKKLDKIILWVAGTCVTFLLDIILRQAGVLK